METKAKDTRWLLLLLETRGPLPILMVRAIGESEGLAETDTDYLIARTLACRQTQIRSQVLDLR
jgi:hypothetical protein